jgi:integrase
VVALANIKRVSGRTVFRYTTKAAADKSWRAVIKRAGLAPLSFHCCRHGFATALLRAGVDVITIAKLGGWKDAHHVLKTYGHALDDITLTDRIASANSAQEVFGIVRNPMIAGVS